MSEINKTINFFPTYNKKSDMIQYFEPLSYDNIFVLESLILKTNTNTTINKKIDNCFSIRLMETKNNFSYLIYEKTFVIYQNNECIEFF